MPLLLSRSKSTELVKRTARVQGRGGCVGSPRIVLLAALLALSGCGQEQESAFTGYIEARHAYIAAPQAGWLTALAVEEGQAVSPGALLFTLDDQQQVIAVDQAEAALGRSRAQAADLNKGARPPALAALESQLKAQQAAVDLARAEQRRLAAVVLSHYVSESALDKANAELRAARARQVELQQRLAEARLAARADQQDAAAQAVSEASAAVANARWLLSQRQINAAAAATVEEIMYRPGEFVAAGVPVVALLLADSGRVRFFVPQARLPEITLGQKVQVLSDGSETVAATVDFIAREAEFTPPVIYSKDSRAELVFRVEAALVNASALPVGLPVDVELTP